MPNLPISITITGAIQLLSSKPWRPKQTKYNLILQHPNGTKEKALVN